MRAQTKIYFATDIHGSELCFRKFLNAGPLYKADVMIMGGDLAGKELLVISPRIGRSGYSFKHNGKVFEIESESELLEAKQFIADLGLYSYVGNSEDIQAMQQEQTFETFMETLMRERMLKWLSLADKKLRNLNMPLYWMLGNDDPQSWADYLRNCSWGTYAEDNAVKIDDHEMISWGYANPTPWQTAREQSEEELLESLEKKISTIENLEKAIFNIHAPPFESGLDEAPLLNDDWVPQNEGGQVKMVPVGSKSVRQVIDKYQPLLGLHGHIHESQGFRKLGRTLVINPGSDHTTGTLNGVLVTLKKGKLVGHQIVRG